MPTPSIQHEWGTIESGGAPSKVLVQLTGSRINKNIEEIEDTRVTLRDPLQNVRDRNVHPMDEHLTDYLFCNVKEPAKRQCHYSNRQNHSADHILHGRRGDSRVRL
jgi:hypothetical protein